MVDRKRWWAYAIAVVALALTVVGVVLAATDPNPGEIAKDPLVLNGYPPKTADLLVTVSAGSSVSLRAEVGVNFESNRVSAVAEVPLVVSTASIDVRMAAGHLYLRSADVSSGPWYSLAVRLPALFGFSLEMTKPDIDLITGFRSEHVTTSGYSTTYSFYRDRVALTHLFAGSNAQSVLGSVRWTITVGSQGEVSESTLEVRAKGTTTDVVASVLSYNKPVVVTRPGASSVEPITPSQVDKILMSASLQKFLIPRELTSLGAESLS